MGVNINFINRSRDTFVAGRHSYACGSGQKMTLFRGLGWRSAMRLTGCSIERSTACAQPGKARKTRTTVILESRVFESILTHPEDHLLFDQVSGAHRIDFVGTGRFQGLSFELTTELDASAHATRGYVNQPGAMLFRYTPRFK